MEQVISVKTAKLAKEKKFNIKCPYWYGCDNPASGENSNKLMCTPYRVDELQGQISDQEGTMIYSAPTQSLLKKWLRKEHKIHVNAYPNSDNEGNEPIKWFYSYISRYDNSIHDDAFGCSSDEEFDSYENALEQALFESLELIGI